MKHITKKLKITVVTVLILGVVASLVIDHIYTNSKTTNNTFTGVVTAIKECDEFIGIGGDTCTWVVSGKDIKYSWGSSINQNTSVISGLDINGGNGDIGKSVEVRAHRVGYNQYELQDSSDYIIVK